MVHSFHKAVVVMYVSYIVLQLQAFHDAKTIRALSVSVACCFIIALIGITITITTVTDTACEFVGNYN